MPRRFALTALVLGLGCALAHAQRGAVSSLARALRVWAATDRDQDERIRSDEAASIPIDAAEFRRADVDGDGAWSREEFLLFYRSRLIAAREPVGADLELELVRQHALKQARAIEAARGVTAARAASALAGAADPAIGAALTQLERRLDERSARPADVARLRQLVHAKSPARPLPGPPASSRSRSLAAIEPEAELDALLDRIERAVARGENAPADRASLRALLMRRGCIASAPAQIRLEQRRGTPAAGPVPLHDRARRP